jgi:hypothetical protein
MRFCIMANASRAIPERQRNTVPIKTGKPLTTLLGRRQDSSHFVILGT